MLTILPLLFIFIVPSVTSQCIVGVFVEFGKRVNKTAMGESRRGCRFISVAPCKPYMIFGGAPLENEDQFRIGCFPIPAGIECHCGSYGGCNADPDTIRRMLHLSKLKAGREEEYRQCILDVLEEIYPSSAISTVDHSTTTTPGSPPRPFHQTNALLWSVLFLAVGLVCFVAVMIWRNDLHSRRLLSFLPPC